MNFFESYHNNPRSHVLTDLGIKLFEEIKVNPEQEEDRKIDFILCYTLSFPNFLTSQVTKNAKIRKQWNLYTFFFRHLRSGFIGSVPDLVLDLLISIEDFVKDLQELYGNLEELESRLAHSCYKLRLSIIAFGNEQEKDSLRRSVLTIPTTLENCHLNLESPLGSREELDSYVQPNQGRRLKEDSKWAGRHGETQKIVIAEIAEEVMRIGSIFSQVVNQRIRRDLNSILDLIGNGGLIGRVSLQVLSTILYDGGLHMCKLASSIRTVCAILNALIDSQDEYDQILCLRCLATILSIGDAVNDFDKVKFMESS